MEMILYRKGERFVVLYDECDHKLVSAYKWLITSDGYVLANFKGTYALMHRMILNAPKGSFIDHKNRIKTDNRRENIRFCTLAQNQQNRDKCNKRPSTSKYRGVSMVYSGRGFRASIRTGKRTIPLGRFDNEEEAARAYDKAARELHGEFANPNFPE